MSMAKAFVIGVLIGISLKVSTTICSQQSEPRPQMEVRNCWSLKVDFSCEKLSAEFVTASEAREE